MRRSKIGDVYSVKVPNGYKLFQRAYDIPRMGRFVRVFDGLYETIPDNITEIVAGPHSYIINFYSSRAYRIGLAQLVGNFPVPDQYPFPEYMFGFWQSADGSICQIDVLRTDVTGLQTFQVGRLEELPPQFQELKLLRSVVSPNWILYLFDINWSPAKLEKFNPGLPGEDFAVKLQIYTDMVNQALERDRLARKKSK